VLAWRNESRDVAMRRVKNNGFVRIIREGIRDTVRDTLRSVVQDATEQELRAALREKAIRQAIPDLVRQELHEAMQSLRAKPKPGSRTTRSL